MVYNKPTNVIVIGPMKLTKLAYSIEREKKNEKDSFPAMGMELKTLTL